MTQEELADEAGYHRNTFGTYLRERPPSQAAVEALADALEERAEMLVDYAERLREAASEQPAKRHSIPAKKRRGRR